MRSIRREGDTSIMGFIAIAVVEYNVDAGLDLMWD